MHRDASLPLFRAFPAMGARLPRASLGTLPTPAEKMESVGARLGLPALYIKRDDLTGEVYGGNKVRKLEFLLADALRRKAEEVITFGYAGSNHALATGIYARRLGLKCTAMLMSQPNAQYVRRNLLMASGAGIELRHYSSRASLSWAVILRAIGDALRPRAARVYYVPPGGTCPLGIAGYVNAAFELAEQVRCGMMPKPDLVYVALGSMGTAAGLALGLKAVGLDSQVVAVRVIEERVCPRRKLFSLIQRTGKFLRQCDAAFPQLRIAESDVTVRDEFLGKGYARATAESAYAGELLETVGGIATNGTYTAKAFAALMQDARGGTLDGKTILFWNTYNSRPFPIGIDAVDYRSLPKEFHPYFRTEVEAQSG